MTKKIQVRPENAPIEVHCEIHLIINHELKIGDAWVEQWNESINQLRHYSIRNINAKVQGRVTSCCVFCFFIDSIL